MNENVFKIMIWCYQNFKDKIIENSKPIVLTLTISITILSMLTIHVARTWYPPPASARDKVVEQLIQQYIALGVNLRAFPDPCDITAVKKFNQAVALYTTIESYAPYTKNPAVYQMFLDTNNSLAIGSIIGSCEKN